MAEEKKAADKKKTKRIKKSSFYKIEEDKIVRDHKCCPKCGSGVFLASHKDRFTCGKCQYTEWKK